MVDPKPIYVTLDSGACDAVCPPSAFPNIKLNGNNRENGKQYGACGGEAVKNIGSKAFSCVTSGGIQHTYTFQVGDKLTKPLLAVSKVCKEKKGVFFWTRPEV